MPKIQVGIRVRPLPESSSNNFIPGLNIPNNSDTNSTLEIVASGLTHEFSFDHIFNMGTTQFDIFDRCASPIIKAATDGYNGCVILKILKI